MIGTQYILEWVVQGLFPSELQIPNYSQWCPQCMQVFLRLLHLHQLIYCLPRLLMVAACLVDYHLIKLSSTYFHIRFNLHSLCPLFRSFSEELMGGYLKHLSIDLGLQRIYSSALLHVFQSWGEDLLKSKPL